MKRIALFSTVLFLGLSAEAAQLQTCFNQIAQCGYVSLGSVISDGDGAADCKIAQAGRREDGSWYNKKVVFYDRQSIVSVEVPNSRFASCTAAKAEFLRGIREAKVIDGRIALVGNNGHFYMVTRTNMIRRLDSSNGQPYYNVVDVRIDQANDALYLTYLNGQTKRLSWSEILRKVNSPYESTLVSGETLIPRF
ncbi:MAG: hypothetical protein K2X47_13400 [Bdellovibrionales bacterium]|nr:hypothetical protein [Bdellovibrionales bacterium]